MMGTKVNFPRFEEKGTLPREVRATARTGPKLTPYGAAPDGRDH